MNSGMKGPNMSDPFDYLSRIPEPHQSVARRVEEAMIAYSGAHGWPRVYTVTAGWPMLNAIASAARYIPFGTSLDEPFSWGAAFFRRVPDPTMPENTFALLADDGAMWTAGAAQMEGWTDIRDTVRKLRIFVHRGGLWFRVTDGVFRMHPECDPLGVADAAARAGATGEHLIELTVINNVMSARCVPVGSG